MIYPKSHKVGQSQPPEIKSQEAKCGLGSLSGLTGSRGP